MRKQIAAANWKMNGTWSQAHTLLQDILNEKITMGGDRLTLFAVPFPYLTAIHTLLKNHPGYAVAAQNCHHERSGAFTGEVSAAMLQSLDVRYCLIGHSERREFAGETNQRLAQKIDLCLEQGITPVFCCGEPLPVREAHQQNVHVAQQLHESLFHLSGTAIQGIVIAYEPIWAIGTGKTASAAQAQEMHAHIRNTLELKYGPQVAGTLPILYGGSVKAANAKELFSQTDVDGGLVGGASLVAQEFCAIMKSLK